MGELTLGYAIVPPKPPNDGMQIEPPDVESVCDAVALVAVVVWPVHDAAAATVGAAVGFAVAVGATVGATVAVGAVVGVADAPLAGADGTGVAEFGPLPAATVLTGVVLTPPLEQPATSAASRATAEMARVERSARCRGRFMRASSSFTRGGDDGSVPARASQERLKLNPKVRHSTA